MRCHPGPKEDLKILCVCVGGGGGRLLINIGAKYLVFISSRSLKSVFIFKVLNDKVYSYVKQNIIVNFIIQKLKNKHTFLKKYTN
jgi:hypothetical protein